MTWVILTLALLAIGGVCIGSYYGLLALFVGALFAGLGDVYGTPEAGDAGSRPGRGWRGWRLDPTRMVDMARAGDVLLCRDESLLSRIIQRVGRSPWSHCALVLRLGLLPEIGAADVVESTFPWGRLVPLGRWLAQRRHATVYLARHPGVDPWDGAPWVEDGQAWAVRHAAAPYAWRDLLKVLVLAAGGPVAGAQGQRQRAGLQRAGRPGPAADGGGGRAA